VPTHRKLCSSHRAANTALSKHIQASSEAAIAAGGPQDMIRISVESEESDIITDSGDGQLYFAVISVDLSKPAPREFSAQGPLRDSKAEAVKDGDVLGRVFQLEGEAGVLRVAKRLERKRWSAQEMDSADDSCLEGLLVLSGVGTKQEKLIPPGEGWTRVSDEMLWDSRSQVHFVQAGDRMGQYLLRDGKATGGWREVDPPHAGVEHPICARGAGANVVRRGAKLERTVLLGELPKIARLALKFPLSFVDTPASAYALFQGLRSAEAADWCAKHFHTKLIPQLAMKIHAWETRALQDVLKKVLQDLDAELLKSPCAFSGCSAAVALLLGDRLVVSGVGQVRVVLLFEDKSTRQLLACTSELRPGSADRERAEGAGGVVRDGLLHRCVESADDAQRILASRHAFEVLQLEAGGPADVKQVRTAYKRLALRVHPDKLPEGVDVESYNKAFARLEGAKEAVECMLNEDPESCRELHKVLRVEIHGRDAAAELLGVSKQATTDTELVAEEAEKAAAAQIKRLEKMQLVSKDHGQAVAMCWEAVETLRRPNSPEALPRHEALLRVGLPTTRAMGARDLRFPSPLVLMEPECMAWHVPTDKKVRVALLCGATAALADQQLATSTAHLRRQPKAAALRWCLDADPSASSTSAVCIGFENKAPEESTGPAAKRQRTVGAATGGQQSAGNVFLRHMLFKHQQLKVPDPSARRDGAARGPAEAEAKALRALEKLLLDPNSFLKLCRELSDCQSAAQPGQLAGQLGWLARGEQEPSFEEAAFALRPNEFSDIVTTARGVHIIQRLG